MLSITKIGYILLKCTKVSDPVHLDNKGGNELMLIAQMTQEDVMNLVSNGGSIFNDYIRDAGIHIDEGASNEIRISVVVNVDRLSNIIKDHYSESLPLTGKSPILGEVKEINSISNGVSYIRTIECIKMEAREENATITG